MVIRRRVVCLGCAKKSHLLLLFMCLCVYVCMQSYDDVINGMHHEISPVIQAMTSSTVALGQAWSNLGVSKIVSVQKEMRGIVGRDFVLIGILSCTLLTRRNSSVRSFEAELFSWARLRELSPHTRASSTRLYTSLYYSWLATRPGLALLILVR